MASISAKYLSCIDGLNQSIREVALFSLAILERIRNRVDQVCTYERVTLNGVVPTGSHGYPVSLGLGTVLLGSSPLCGPAPHVNDTNLSMLPAVIGSDHTIHRFLWYYTTFKQIEEIITVFQAGSALSRNRAHTGTDPGYGIADAWPTCRNRNTRLSGERVDGDNGKSVELEIRAPCDRLLCKRWRHRGYQEKSQRAIGQSLNST
jgi:hypothetical protein